MNWSDLRLRLRALLFRRRVEDELDEELRFHLAMQTRSNLHAGMSPPEARRDAAIRFGGFTQHKEECRDARGVRFLATLAQDVRYALRGFRRTPGFAATVIATIGIGLGLNTTLFSLFNAYVLQPVMVRDPYQLYRLTWSTPSGQGHSFRWREFQDLQQQKIAFTEVAGIRRVSFARVDGHLMLGQMVTGNYFQMLGVDAVLGRTLLPEDAAAPGGAPVAVLSYAAWQKKFAGDPGVLGRKIAIHGYPVEVIGVARPQFRGISEVPLDYWVPLTLAPYLEEGASLFSAAQPERLDILGRLQNGLTLRQAKRALDVWARQQTAGRPDSEQAVGVVLRSQATILPLDPIIIAAFSPLLLAFGLVLVIACANVANMMLARAMARQRELGIRLAMGAAQARLVRQLLTECLLLALPAAALGLWVSQQSIVWSERLVLSTLPSGYLEFITIVPVQLDVRVFMFMLAAAGVAALLFGLAPALQATRPGVMQAARGEFTTDFRAGRMRDALVIGQVTVSVLLLVCAAVLLRANNRIRGLDVGLQTKGIVALNLQDSGRAKAIQQLSIDAGVPALAAVSKVPFTGILPLIPVGPEHGPDRFQAGYLYTSPEYFAIFHVPILSGRGFTRDEAAGKAAVAVISQATARKLWPGQDALGQSLVIDHSLPRRRSLADMATGAPEYSSVRVIGIARDVVNGWVGDGLDSTCIYFPVAVHATGATLLARVQGDVAVAVRRLDAALAASVPGAVDQIHPMDEILAAQIYPFRALYWLSSAVGGLALLLTLSGIYGVLSYVVTQRTKEIGIRVALGAAPGVVARLVLGQSIRFALIGAAIGSTAAAVIIRVSAPLIDLPLFGAFDAWSFGMVFVLVIAASAAAAWIPSRRAAGIEPLTTLRCD